MQDEFTQQVRDLLAHLYDYEFLQQSSLADMLDRDARLAPRERMRLLRSTLLSGLDELIPGSEVSPYSPRVRSHSVLSLHYVDRLTIQQVALELAVSERQVYRDLRQAEQELAQILWNRLKGSGAGTPSGSEMSRVDLALRELNRLPADELPIDLCSLLGGARATVEKMAEQRGVRISACPTTGLGTVRGSRHAIRQILLGALSYLVQHARPGTEIEIRGRESPVQVALEVTFSPDSSELAPPEVTLGLVERQGGKWLFEGTREGEAVLTLVLSDQRPYHVLVIDDNEGLIALFQRYLTGEQFRVTGARDGQDGLAKAEATMPDIIVLDVLMPGQDGWEVLQRLRGSESTQNTPVVVCSVFDNPALAYSLGATGFLPKPVNRQDLVTELSRYLPPSRAG